MSYPQGFRECHGDYRTEADLEEPTLPLYQHQKNLPRLPIPDLKTTCELYLRTVKPLSLVSSSAYQQTEQIVKEFMKPGGFGEELQKRLKARAAERSDSSFLAEWWNTLGYLQVRDPVVFNVSYFFHFSDSIHPEQQTQAGRAASLLRATMLFRGRIADGSLEPERLGKAKTPLCATAYKYMFNACRIPHRVEDSYRIYDPTKNNHVVVMRHNKFYVVELAQQGQILSCTDIQKQLEYIIANAGPKESPLGALTSHNRDCWADAREQLLKDGNESMLQVIESAVVVVCLDDSTPVSRKDVARGLWHGDGKNRWYDKAIELIVYENGKAGLLGEHSMLDGMAMTVYADYMLTGLLSNTIDMGNPRSKPLPPPKRLKFKFSTPTLKNIASALRTFNSTADDHEVQVESFYGYGNKQIKQLKCSPDAFVQMAIQLAYFKLFHRNGATYEASQVRAYLHGRTETTRSVSIESAQWVQAMLNPKSTKAQRADLLYKATTSHVNYMRNAAKSHGVDRHLLALKLCCKPGESAPIFEDASYAISKHWHISTSHLTHELFDGWGWGEVVPDGVGVAYMIKKESCHFNIASRKRNWTGPLCHLLEESLLEMKALLLSVQPSPPARL